MQVIFDGKYGVKASVAGGTDIGKATCDACEKIGRGNNVDSPGQPLHTSSVVQEKTLSV